MQQNNVEVFCKLHPRSNEPGKAFILFSSHSPVWISSSSILCDHYKEALIIKCCHRNLLLLFLPIYPGYVISHLVAPYIVALSFFNEVSLSFDIIV